MESTALKPAIESRASGLLAFLDLIAKASSQLLDPSTQIESILPAILDVAKSLITADAYAVWRVCADQSWNILASSGLSDTYKQQVIEPNTAEIPRETIAIPDVLQHTLVADRRKLYKEEGISSLLVAPLVSSDEVIGALTFYFRNEHRSPEDELHLATALGNLTASALASSAQHREQTRIQKQSQFLAQASAVLSSSVNYEVTLAAVAKLAVPHIADWCAIDIFDHGKLHRVGVAHVDDSKLELAHEYRRLYPPDLHSDSGVGAVVRTGKAQYFPHVTPEMVVANARDERHREFLTQLGLQSFAIVPLKARERVLGAFTLVTASRDLDFREFKLAEELADRAAVAIDNARLFGALEESERKFRTVADTVPCAIYIHDGERLIYVNQAAECLTGYTSAELSSMRMLDLVHPDHREMIGKRVTSRLKGDTTPSRFEFKGIRKDGAVVWVDFAGALVEFEGRPALLATAFDITERKLAEAQLRKNEQEARFLLENIPDTVARYDRELRYAYISPVVERLTGIPAPEFIGKRHSEIGLPAELCDLFDNSLRKVFATGSPDRINFTMSRPDGQTKYLSGLGLPLFDAAGNVEHVLTISHDLTADRKAQDAVARSEGELRILTDILPALVAYVSAEEKFLRVNQTFEQWFGHPKSYFIGRSLAEVLGKNYENIAIYVAQVLRGQTVQYETMNDYADKQRHVLITYVPDFDDQQRVRGFAALVQDVSERRLAEDALRKTEKLAAVGRLAASISHEINNPLEAVTNLIFLAKHDAGITERARDFLQMAEKELARVSQIATQTLRFYRQSSKPTRVNLKETIASVLGLYEGRIQNSQINIRQEFRNGEQTVEAMEGELRQVLANLVGNAIDATPRSGMIRLRVSAARSGINQVSAVRISIADNGCGINSDLRPRIFEPFFTTKSSTGTGLGLWVSREIIDKHRGTIHVRSRNTPGASGTVFSIVLPTTFVGVREAVTSAETLLPTASADHS